MIENSPLSTPLGPVWDKLGLKPHHGMVTPLFSLRSEKSTGIGEYLDLIPFVDLVRSCGMDLIQLLPLNDTGMDSSPYSIISSCALHPIYLSLWALPHVEHELLLPLEIKDKDTRLDWNGILELKYDFLKAYFKEHLGTIKMSSDFQSFVNSEPWLRSHAAYLSKKHGHFTEEEEMVLQYLCFSQMKKVKAYAEGRGVFLIGDLPILIQKDSADAEIHPEWFDFTLTAGAPPDYFNEEGQGWGFPLYNWEEVEKSDWQYWKERVVVAEELYHAFRLDHIIGFFRIWAIPNGHKPKEGFFHPDNIPENYLKAGRDRLSKIISFSTMLPLGEDLGAVTAEVRGVLKSLGIPGMKVLRWERNWNTDGSYTPLEEYPFESLTTVSTHDSETLGEWWELCPNEASAFALWQGFDYKTPLSYETRFEILRLSHITHSAFHINLFSEYLHLFPNLYPPPLSDRINVPGLISSQNWSLRYPTTIETIQQDPLFIKTINQLITPISSNAS